MDCFWQKSKCVVCGNPMRLSLRSYASKAVARRHFFSKAVVGKGDCKVVLVLGGSLGANALNVAILHLYSEKLDERKDLFIIWKIGVLAFDEMDSPVKFHPRLYITPVESQRYFHARRTILEMLKDRGFAIPNSEIDTTLHEFRDKYGDRPDIERLRISAMHRNDVANKVLVIFCGPNAVKVTVIRSILAQIMNKESLSRLILIIQNQMTNQAMKAVELFSFKVEIFQITDLLVNITKHVLKPKHEVLTKEEKEKLLKKYNLEEKQLPRMSQKDAIARYYGLEKGQVVKVTYSSEIIETHVTFRCVW